MKTVIYANTAQIAKRTRKPRTGETVGYRSFDDFKGAEKGFTKVEIIGDTDIADKILKAYSPKRKKDEQCPSITQD